jgi:hypothetical protein
MPGLERGYLEHLGHIGGILSYQLEPPSEELKDPAYDGTLAIQTATGVERLFILQYRSHLTHKIMDHILAERQRNAARPLLLFAPSIGAPLGAKLASSGINYLDRYGNCHLSFGALYVHIEGRRGPPLPKADKGLRSAGYQVLFCFLAQPDLLNAPVRSVAALAGVSRQPVSDTKGRLLEEEYIIKTGRTFQWVPRRQHDALNLWLHGYETTVRPSLIWGTYRTPDKSPQELEERIVSTCEDIGISDFRWGGSAAGFRLTGHFRGESTVVHIHSSPGILLAKLRMLSAPQGNVILMDAFGEINWPAGQQTVHPLLVYSEMLRENSERASEGAHELFEKQLQSYWSGTT